MRILLVGAAGFIGGHFIPALTAQGHEVHAVARRPDMLRRRWPGLSIVQGDLARDTDAEVWRPRLAGMDAVVNAAGLFAASPETLLRVHVAGPLALYEACRRVGVRRVVHISALGADAGAPTAYARSKRQAEDALAAMSDLDWIILRPSLVYGGAVSGGMAMLRALAAAPFRIPVIGDGAQRVSPIHVDDLTRAVATLVSATAPARLRIDAVGADRVTLRDLLVRLRGWLGLPQAPLLRVPARLAAGVARLGDALGWPTLNGTALRLLGRGNAADAGPFAAAAGFRPAGFAEGLARQPATAQDLRAARLYPVRPVLRWSLGLTWLFSGVASLLPAGLAFGLAALGGAGIPAAAAYAAIGLGAAADLAIGAALLARWRVRAVGAVSILVMLAYTVAATLVVPERWLDPLGPLLKNAAVFGATLALVALEDER